MKFSALKSSLVASASCAALLLLSPSPGARAEEKAPAQAAPPPASSEVDADALAALKKMGASLRTHNDFVMNADVTKEDVLASGEKLQFAGTLEVRAHRPDGFKISTVSDTQERQIYYDGKKVTVYAPRLKVYASFDAPPTIAQTITVARERRGIEVPLADLFTWGESNDGSKLTSGFLVRPEHIEGRACDHYAFRQPNVDWQIWIAQDAGALPCKVVITKTDDDSRPQYTAVMHWTFPGVLQKDAFAFTPPAGSNKIVMAQADAPQSGGSTP